MNILKSDLAEKIKSLELQESRKMILLATTAFQKVFRESARVYLKKNSRSQKNAEKFFENLQQACKKIIALNPGNPSLYNTIYFWLGKCRKNDAQKNLAGANEISVKKKFAVEEIFEIIDKKVIKIAIKGATKIRSDMIIQTHCYSTTVINILSTAKKQGKKFQVFTTETRPRFQGRLTAKELSEAGIKVSHYVDMLGPQLIQSADLFLCGADAIDSQGNIITKIGTKTLLEAAKRYHVPAFICADSWKKHPAFDYSKLSKNQSGLSEIEPRPPKEIWPNAPKKVLIKNPGFELIPRKLFRGLIQ